MDKKEDMENQYLGKYYSNQMNIAVFVDVRKALMTRSLKTSVYAVDNSGHSIGNGTPELRSFCRQGTVLNWVIYGLDMERRPDGSWPTMPAICNLVFEEGESGDVSASPVCDDLRIYGGPDKSRSEYTPAYSYWAGCVRMDLPPGIYHYNLVIEMRDELAGRTVCMNAEGLSLQVEAMV